MMQFLNEEIMKEQQQQQQSNNSPSQLYILNFKYVL